MSTFVSPYECRGKFDDAGEAIDRLRASAGVTNWPFAVLTFQALQVSPLQPCHGSRNESDGNFSGFHDVLRPTARLIGGY
ncbi:MAG: hypothetical protein E3K36_10955 [Candidatus Brocadia sp.]|nr:hypothetical protein [Candidatus Brocadia sp.]